ncbi:uroporphyrinogen-III synthase [Paenibacillus glucanolyticus]|jgi:uroporphyrinogen-III synthase|uniref:uroporphyrinogen-III synthase n=1 Tax=Paenibacillus TaxID=44249 RepID=UPI0003E29D9D|nr:MULTISPECIES: uroporphyrinogen-III synthase [Paenibacillus]ANA79885.1 uroporphyrinogen-III synthase [Paenibacillus glucanolyticus]AVV56091.1 uroporphyrinogen-III synthase [Paenibacillus glucanolyticus]ETT38265.1 uroporphyrinogen-III synthase [Paenibacillus sp. FSL R5-808]
MAQHMKDRIVALAGPRKAADMAKLVEKMGGRALLRPAQGTVFLDDEVLRSSIEAWLKAPAPWAIFTTGIGLEAIYDMAEQMGLMDTLNETMQHTFIAARGYKTANALKKRGLAPVVRDDDGSTAGLIRSLEPHDFTGKRVILQLHGESAPKLVEWLEGRGAAVEQILPYQHIPPLEEDISQLVDEIIGGKVHAVAFTSAPQFRFLADYARAHGKLEAVLEAFRGPVLAAAVGKVTAQGLREEGIERMVVPEEERMGSMMVTLGRYFAQNQE